MKKDNYTKSELDAAYDICILIKSHSDNVLAMEDSEADKEWSRKATKFIKAYERVNAYKTAKEGKAGALGDALSILEKMEQSIKSSMKSK